MTKCTLCMTEVDPAAVVCRGCGATKMLVRKQMGYLKGGLMLAIMVWGLLLVMAGRYGGGFICIGIGCVLPRTQPKQLMWVRHTIRVE